MHNSAPAEAAPSARTITVLHSYMPVVVHFSPTAFHASQKHKRQHNSSADVWILFSTRRYRHPGTHVFERYHRRKSLALVKINNSRTAAGGPGSPLTKGLSNCRPWVKIACRAGPSRGSHDIPARTGYDAHCSSHERPPAHASPRCGASPHCGGAAGGGGARRGELRHEMVRRRRVRCYRSGIAVRGRSVCCFALEALALAGRQRRLALIPAWAGGGVHLGPRPGRCLRCAIALLGSAPTSWLVVCTPQVMHKAWQT